jgi:RHS repeat-associated protein
VSESFTPFGVQRNGETWSGAPIPSDESTINSVSRNGYTGQTVLGVSMGINHLNGRLEDAVAGRMLSPDPYVPDPGNTQSWNRYSYVNNNPLTFIDPTGFDQIPQTTGDDQWDWSGAALFGELQALDVEGTRPCGAVGGLPCAIGNWPLDIPDYRVRFVPSDGAGDRSRDKTNTQRNMPCPKVHPSDFSKYVFLNNQIVPASAVAATLGVDPSLLVGLSALESGWGSSAMYRNQNDPFGATPNGTDGVTYSSYSSAWNNWGSQWGARVTNVGSNTSAFVGNLLMNNQGRPGAVDQRGSYNSVNPGWGGSVTATIGSVQARLPDALAAFSPGCN